jgi:hypothetical protein
VDITNVDKSKGDYDADLAIEMDVILSVMNRLFDEDDNEYYIGNKDILYPIKNQTNNVLININGPNVIPKRQNTGTMLLPPLQSILHNMSIPRRTKTAKIRRNTRNLSVRKNLFRKTLSKSD